MQDFSSCVKLMDESKVRKTEMAGLDVNYSAVLNVGRDKDSLQTDRILTQKWTQESLEFRFKHAPLYDCYEMKCSGAGLCFSLKDTCFNQRNRFD